MRDKVENAKVILSTEKPQTQVGFLFLFVPPDRKLVSAKSH